MCCCTIYSGSRVQSKLVAQGSMQASSLRCCRKCAATTLTSNGRILIPFNVNARIAMLSSCSGQMVSLSHQYVSHAVDREPLPALDWRGRECYTVLDEGKYLRRHLGSHSACVLHPYLKPVVGALNGVGKSLAGAESSLVGVYGVEQWPVQVWRTSPLRTLQ